MTAAMRIWLALLPGLVVLGLFFAGYVAFAIRFRGGDLPRYPEVEERPASRYLGHWLRTGMIWMLRPIEDLLIRCRITPNRITASSSLLALLGGVALAHGRFALGGWLYLFSGIFDIFDGRIARRTGNVSRFGGVLDSVSDRYGEFFAFAGLAWFYRGTPVVGLVVLAIFGSLMVSYVGARSEAAGVSLPYRGWRRPERVLYLGLPVALSPVVAALFETRQPPMHWVAVVAIGIIALGANVSAVRRFRDVRIAMTGPAPGERSPSSAMPSTDRRSPAVQAVRRGGEAA